MDNETLYLQLLLNHFTGSNLLSTKINGVTETHIKYYLEVTNTYDSISKKHYYKLEGLKRKEFKKIENIDGLKNEIKDQLDRIKEYIESLDSLHKESSHERLNERFIVNYSEIDMNIFKKILLDFNYYSNDRKEISLLKFFDNTINTLSELFPDLGDLIVEKNLQKNVQKRLLINDNEIYTNRILWEKPISELCRIITKKMNSSNLDVIFNKINDKYFIRKYRNRSKENYDNSLKKAIRSWLYQA